MTSIIQIEEFRVIGKSTRIDPKLQGKDIMNFWQEFWKRHNPQELKQMPLALYYDYEDDYSKPYSLLIGFKTQNGTTSVKEDEVCITVPSQSVQVFQNSGSMPSVVFSTWKEVWNSNIKRSFTFDIEEYVDKNTVKLSIGVKNH